MVLQFFFRQLIHLPDSFQTKAHFGLSFSSNSQSQKLVSNVLNHQENIQDLSRMNVN